MDRRSFNKLAALAGMSGIVAAQEALERVQEPRKTAWDRYLLGSSYYPEWWEPSEWKTDFRQMQELGLNTVDKIVRRIWSE